ncbi:MAG TPA: dihydrodipicolinate synthase family protein, partial [Hanamia sp.]|nr:dihydrodipicolinate synthase family protein [Hanamia sp.]
MNNHRIHGLVAAPFTPMHEDGSLNVALIPEYYQFLKQNKVTGAFICGSTGEGASLTMQEKKDIAQAWASCTKDDKDFKVLLLTGGTCMADCIELAKYAQQLCLHAISFTAPFYFKPGDVATLAACCKKIASVVPDMPFYYYHIPVFTGVNFPMIDLLKIVDGDIPNFAGIKYTNEDFMDFLSCLHFQNGKYDMLWGRDENLLSALALGAKGAVGSTYNYAAPVYYDLIQAFNTSDMKRAQELQQQSIDMITLLGKYGGGISIGKAYMKLVGLDCGVLRLPMKNISAENYELFKKDTEQINFKSFCSRLS